MGANALFSTFFLPSVGAWRACADLGLLSCPIGAQLLKRVWRAAVVVVVVVVAAAAAKLLGRAGRKRGRRGGRQQQQPNGVGLDF